MFNERFCQICSFVCLKMSKEFMVEASQQAFCQRHGDLLADLLGAEVWKVETQLSTGMTSYPSRLSMTILRLSFFHRNVAGHRLLPKCNSNRTIP